MRERPGGSRGALDRRGWSDGCVTCPGGIVDPVEPCSVGVSSLSWGRIPPRNKDETKGREDSFLVVPRSYLPPVVFSLRGVLTGLVWVSSVDPVTDKRSLTTWSVFSVPFPGCGRSCATGNEPGLTTPDTIGRMDDNMKIKKTNVAVSNTNTAKPEANPPVKPSAEAVAVLLKEKPVVSPPAVKEPMVSSPTVVTPKVTKEPTKESPKEPSKVSSKEPERRGSWNPYYIPEPKVGMAVVVPVLGRFRSGVVLSSRTGGKFLIGKIEGVTENVVVHHAELFPTLETAREARAWAERLVREQVPPTKGGTVAVFDPESEGDYPRATMYPGQVVSEPADTLLPDGGTLTTVSVFFAWENTTDPRCPVSNLRDARCVSDPFVRRFADAYVTSENARVRGIEE